MSSFHLKLRLRATKSVNTNAASTSVSRPNSPKKVDKNESWRQMIKRTSPKEYEAFLRHDAAANRLRRLEKKEKLDKPENADMKRAEQAKKAAYMREFRERKKLEKMKEDAEQKTTNEERKKAKTRAETDKERAFKDKDAARQRRRRAAMSLKQKKEINKRRCQKRRTERQLIEDVVRQQQELDEQRVRQKKQLEEEAKRLMDEWSKLEKEKDARKASPAKRKRLSRARASLSKNPLLFAETVTDLVNKASPRKKGLLSRNLKMHVKDWRSHVSDALAEKMSAIHKSRKKKDIVLKRAIGSTLQVCKKYRMQGKVSRALKMSSKSFKTKPLNRDRRKISPFVKKAVHDCYEECSITLPDKRFVSKKSGKPAGFLTQPIMQVYSKFKAKHPSTKMGFSKFATLRPPHIKTRSAIKYRGCLCEYCANVELKMTLINQQARRDNLATPFVNIYDVANSTMCRKDGKYHKLECVMRECNECGVANISTVLEPLRKRERGSIAWKKWEREDETKKMVLKAKLDNLDHIINDLKDDLEPFTQHLLTASWQSRQYFNLAKDPPRGWVVMVYDFAENYSCRYQDEIQSVHWGHSAATLHPIVCNYRCAHCDDIVTHSLIMVSDDISHDYHAVHQFTQMAIPIIQSQINIDRIVRFSDGAPNQYKSRGPFLDVSYADLDYGIPFQHEFFGSRHGKGPSDGESGVIKRLATDAVMAGTSIIRDAKEMFNFVRDNAVRPTEEMPGRCYHFRRDAIWVSSESISRDRGRRALKAVDGTRQIHSVVSVKPGVVATRNLSCFCQGCAQKDGDCQNASHVKPYRQRSIPFDRAGPVASTTLTSAASSSAPGRVPPPSAAPGQVPQSSARAKQNPSKKTPAQAASSAAPGQVHQSSAKAKQNPSKKTPALAASSAAPGQVHQSSAKAKQNHCKKTQDQAASSSAPSQVPPPSAAPGKVPLPSARAEQNPSKKTPDHAASSSAPGQVPLPSAAPGQVPPPTSAPGEVPPASAREQMITAREASSELPVQAPPAPQPSITPGDLAMNMYVAVRFASRPKNVLYLAMIVNIEGEDITLAFMESDNSGTFDFTKEKHHVHPVDDICCVLSDPVLVPERRCLKYKFDQAELSQLVKREAAVLK